MTCAPLDLMLQTTPRNVTIQGLAKEYAPKFYDEYKGFVQKVDPTNGGLAVPQSRIRVTNVSIGGSSQSSGSGVHQSKPLGKSSQVTSSGGGTTAS